MSEPKDLLDRLSAKSIFLYGLGLGVVFELVTCIFRFGLEMQSTRDTAWIGMLTFGFRIHHGYIGLVMIIASLLLLPARNGYRNVVLIFGYALLFSDLVHHFIVLWLFTGDPQFDLTYPGS